MTRGPPRVPTGMRAILYIATLPGVLPTTGVLMSVHLLYFPRRWIFLGAVEGVWLEGEVW